jgi:hypothetical protein
MDAPFSSPLTVVLSTVAPTGVVSKSSSIGVGFGGAGGPGRRVGEYLNCFGSLTHAASPYSPTIEVSIGLKPS